jgi:chorismate-pyruvate lyase
MCLEWKRKLLDREEQRLNLGARRSTFYKGDKKMITVSEVKI